MRPFVPVLLLTGLAAVPAAAQTRADTGYVDSPWWMREPVVASIGYVRTELPANRATFQATFQAIEPTAARATERAAAQVRDLTAALRRIGGERIRITTTFQTIPLYDQYRDKDGNLIDNRRADKVDRYQVNAVVTVEVRDIGVLERAYSTAVAARPVSTGSPYFRLVPDNETKTRMYEEAVKDAARRARSSVEAAGGRLGAVKVVDPTGRVCETDVLALREGGEDGLMPTEVESVTVTGARMPRAAYAPPPPPPPPAPPPPGAELEAAAAALQLAIEPPLQELNARACVVYAIG